MHLNIILCFWTRLLFLVVDSLSRCRCKSAVNVGRKRPNWGKVYVRLNRQGTAVVVILLLLDLKIPMQSVLITTNGVSSNPAQAIGT